MSSRKQQPLKIKADLRPPERRERDYSVEVSVLFLFFSSSSLYKVYFSLSDSLCMDFET